MELRLLTLMERTFFTFMKINVFDSARLGVPTLADGDRLDLDGQIQFLIMGRRLANLGKRWYRQSCVRLTNWTIFLSANDAGSDQLDDVVIDKRRMNRPTRRCNYRRITREIDQLGSIVIDERCKLRPTLTTL